jgi:hypothetical protein
LILNGYQSTGNMKNGVHLLLLLLPAFQVCVAQEIISPDSTVVNQAGKSNVEIPLDSVIVPQARKSPLAVAKFKSANIYIKVMYGQPYKRGREIFGETEPYGKIWRMGANEATEITFTKDVRVNGKILKAGTYTIFGIPNADKWTIIFNTELGQWGAYEYDPAKDVLTVDVPVEQTDEVVYEAFTVDFRENRSGADMVFLWDTLKLTVPLIFDK